MKTDEPENVLDRAANDHPVNAIGYTAQDITVYCVCKPSGRKARFTTRNDTYTITPGETLQTILEDDAEDKDERLKERLETHRRSREQAEAITDKRIIEATEDHLVERATIADASINGTRHGREALDSIDDVTGSEAPRKPSTQDVLRRQYARRCYAVSIMYSGVEAIVDDVLNGLRQDHQLLSVYDGADDIRRVLNNEARDDDIVARAKQAVTATGDLLGTVKATQRSLHSTACDMKEKLPTRHRNKVERRYQTANAFFT